MKGNILNLMIATSLLMAGNTHAATKSVSYEQIADKLTATEFREYGVTSPTKVSTRLGELSFTAGGFAGGYPTQETSENLKNELDFQKATQAYIWAVPLVSYYNWFDEQRKFGATDGTIVQYKAFDAKQGILTGNGTTPYAIMYADLKNTGPLVMEVPAGPAAGIIDDMFQRISVSRKVSHLSQMHG